MSVVETILVAFCPACGNCYPAEGPDGIVVHISEHHPDSAIAEVARCEVSR
jgi:hypothetical protein